MRTQKPARGMAAVICGDVLAAVRGLVGLACLAELKFKRL